MRQAFARTPEHPAAIHWSSRWTCREVPVLSLVGAGCNRPSENAARMEKTLYRLNDPFLYIYGVCAIRQAISPQLRLLPLGIRVPRHTPIEKPEQVQRQLPPAAPKHIVFCHGPLLPGLPDLPALFVPPAHLEYHLPNSETTRILAVENTLPRILQSAQEEQLAHRAPVYVLVQLPANGLQQGEVIQVRLLRTAQQPAAPLGRAQQAHQSRSL